ncbi:MAG: UDP-N-acetylglucosamine-peptide N-acetylglucosaminyltransferase, partial [Steroidobacteraceae bacterium]
AIGLAREPRRLADIRAKLAGNLRTAPLFDIAASARHLETAYARMYERHLAGFAPADIHVR